MIHTLLSAEDFRQALANNAKVVVYCQVERDPECQDIKKELDRLAEEHADVSFFALDLDTVRDAVGQELDDPVEPPSYYLFLDGKRVDVVRGAARNLTAALSAHF
ncbi:thioredoxin domain-containing protein [Nocardia sp. NPDC050713]|uniref:thioredoxin domain-containing protein n=1 Tax=unclassified Nocardia TaxID=2637762 RepID=UPI0033ADDE24